VAARALVWKLRGVGDKQNTTDALLEGWQLKGKREQVEEATGSRKGRKKKKDLLSSSQTKYQM
jgi:hypothetical protein